MKCYDMQTYARNPDEVDEMCPTILSHWGTGGGNTAFVVVSPSTATSGRCARTTTTVHERHGGMGVGARQQSRRGHSDNTCLTRTTSVR